MDNTRIISKIDDLLAEIEETRKGYIEKSFDSFSVDNIIQFQKLQTEIFNKVKNFRDFENHLHEFRDSFSKEIPVKNSDNDLILPLEDSTDSNDVIKF